MAGKFCENATTRNTASITLIEPNFLAGKFCGNANFRRVSGESQAVLFHKTSTPDQNHPIKNIRVYTEDKEI